MPHPAQRIKKKPAQWRADGTLTARIAPVVSNTGCYVLNAATLAHLVQALDMSLGKSIDRFRQLERFSMAKLSLNPIDCLNKSSAH